MDTEPTTTYDKLTFGEIAARAPKRAQAIVYAQLDEDQSDLMTDYHASRTVRTVAIGWRTGAREDFRQLRAAAARFEPTKHMGPGRDVFTVRVVIAGFSNGKTSMYGNSTHHVGDYSHWHNELQGDTRGKTFETEAEVEAFLKSQPPIPDTWTRDERDEPVKMSFKWSTHRESVEHRENYSMGAGNYLKASSRHCDGWKVRSSDLSRGWSRDELLEVAPCLFAHEAGNAPATEAGEVLKGEDFAVTKSTVKEGNVEIRFGAKPSAMVREMLKAAGFRWTFQGACWYGPEAKVPAILLAMAHA